MTTQFDQIYHGLSSEIGKFRVAQSGMGWKGSQSQEVVTLEGSRVKWAQWLRVARGFQLRIGLSDHTKEKFDGFLREEHDKIAQLLKNYFGITLETRDVSFKGWNWGVADFQGEDLAFLVSDRTSFELPLNQVANSNIAGRTEVSLEFANISGSSKAGSKPVGDEMVEIRFHVPGTQSKVKGSDAGSQKSDDEDEEVSAAQAFHETIKDRANIGQITGNMILSFEEVLVLTPRGRYDMDMFPDFLRLRGKTYDYKIAFTSIARLFLLPKDDQHVLFILGLSQPIRQGQTRYQYLVMQFTREEEITAELNISEEDIAKYDKLKKNYEDPTYEVISSVFRGLSGKKILGAGSYQSKEGYPGLKANLKAVQGDLFFLEKYIFFVSKSPTLIEISDVDKVVFSRVGSSMGATAARTFDVKIVTKSGPEFSFTSINKEEHDGVETFLKDKKVRVKNEMVPDADMLLAAAGADDDDDEMQSISSEDDDRPRNRAPKTGDLDDEDSEEDEDFQASESDAGSPTDTDSDSSGAETASDASGDRDFTAAKKKVKGKGKSKADGDAPKKAAKKKAAAADSDAEEDAPPKKKAPAKKKAKDDAMDVDDDKPKPKPKPKPKAKAKGSDVDVMDVDEDKPKPKPKPKPKVKKADDEEPPKKKVKTSD